eukprot:TRINITY_DN15369_c0_g1_i2.p1 TRINITY_DN15369_c0_g1~~TRINITY_DN15369_c0_g1_i2.p1  ORF type:complete len:409 (-),score=59.76 TRINITY_DN15369_c0_g1_i2:40-1266(-)
MAIVVDPLMVQAHEAGGRDLEGYDAVPTEGRAGIPDGGLRSKGVLTAQVVEQISNGAADAKQRAKAFDPETCSITSELDCPICYQHFVEPVLAGCGRHTFCRNCLLKSQSVGATPRCPVCRAECQRNATEIPEVLRLTSKLRRLEGDQYDEREASARREREEHLQTLQQLRLAATAQDAGRARHFEVCNAGIAEVNGTYMPGVLPTYVGPTVYRKPNTYIFMYRWHQTHWIIAELRGPFSMGSEQSMLYRAPVDYPHDIPPMHGWEVPPGSRNGRMPPPEVRLLLRFAGASRHSRGTAGNTAAAQSSDRADRAAERPAVRPRSGASAPPASALPLTPPQAAAGTAARRQSPVPSLGATVGEQLPRTAGQEQLPAGEQEQEEAGMSRQVSNSSRITVDSAQAKCKCIVM